MKKIIQFFRQRWVISLFGLIALCLLLWYVGPLFAFAGSAPLMSSFSRLIAILVVGVGWLILTLARALAAQRAGSAMAKGLLETSEKQARVDGGAAEVAVLKERFEEAIALLRKTRRKGGGRLNIYELPWYVIIGPPGAGKTTALLNSGLEFPLAERFGREGLKGVGGTRNCDWWFTDQAVLLDTAGRYTTQDSHATVDRQGWEGFLALLKKYRRRRPINGLLIAISLQDLMLLDGAQINDHANAVRQRVQELYEYFGVRFPIYVLLTKADLVGGFMEFFDDLGQQGRAQAWGMTFPLIAADEEFDLAGTFAREYAQLLARLDERLLDRLAAERDVPRRVAMFGFPREMAALQRVIETFLLGAFRGSRYERVPLLRGVYFTSGTQEGTPIDRIMGSLARTFGLSPRALVSYGGHARSYFLSNLLTQVVFAEEELAGTNRRVERWRAWLQRAAYAGALAVVALVLAGWVVSFFNNRLVIQRVDAQVATAGETLAALAPMQSWPHDARDVLNEVRTIPGGYADRQTGIPWLQRLGLYPSALGREAESAYLRVLHRSFLPRITLRLEQQLGQAASNPEQLFDTLRVYLMLEDPEHFDAKAVKEWIVDDWEQTLPRSLTSEQRGELVGHLDALLEEMPAELPVPLDPNLIARCRAILAQAPPAQQIYARLKSARVGADLKEFRISEAAGADAEQVFVRKSGAPLNEGIPGLYTYDGYWKVFGQSSRKQTEALAAESWVLGKAGEATLQQWLSGADIDAIDVQVQELYLQDFVQLWEDLIYDLQLKPFRNTRHAAEVLDALSGPESPLKRLLVAVERETSLDRPPAGAASAVQGIGDRLAAAVGRAQTAASTAGVPGARLPPQAQRALNVADRFAALNALVRSSEGAPAPIDALLARLNELAGQLNALATAGQRGQGEMERTITAQITGTSDQLKADAAHRPEPLGELLRDLSGDVSGLVNRGKAQQLNTRWQEPGGPYDFCKTAINGRYPLDSSSDVDIAIADFTPFFKPAGKMDAFFASYLKDDVNTNGVPWRWRVASGGTAGATTQALEQFRLAAAIRDAFFGLNPGAPKVSFDLTPVTMDANIDSITIDIEGQRVYYDHGPIEPSLLEWPGPKPLRVRIELVPPVAGASAVLESTGPWAWFRILGEAKVTHTARPEVFDVEFDVGGRRARFQLRAGSAFNPFDLDELQRFRCQGELIR